MTVAPNTMEQWKFFLAIVLAMITGGGVVFGAYEKITNANREQFALIQSQLSQISERIFTIETRFGSLSARVDTQMEYLIKSEQEVKSNRYTSDDGNRDRAHFNEQDRVLRDQLNEIKSDIKDMKNGR